MSREQRGPNEKLGAVLALAGISNAGLARRVNDLGAQRGSDSSLRQDVGGPLGVEGHGAAGRRAAPHRGRHRPEARPSGAAARDRPGGRGSRARGGPRLPQGRRPGGALGHRSLPPRSRGPPGRLRRHLAVPGRIVRSERVRDARLTMADNPGRQLGGARRDRVRTAPAHRSKSATAMCSKLREAAEDARRWDSKYGGGDWRSSHGPGVPAGGGGAAAARLVLRRGGPRAVRRDAPN